MPEEPALAVGGEEDHAPGREPVGFWWAQAAIVGTHGPLVVEIGGTLDPVAVAMDGGGIGRAAGVGGGVGDIGGGNGKNGGVGQVSIERGPPPRPGCGWGGGEGGRRGSRGGV